MKTRDEIERQRHQDQALAGLRESLRPIADDKGYDLDGLLTMVLESRWDADAVADPSSPYSKTLRQMRGR